MEVFALSREHAIRIAAEALRFVPEVSVSDVSGCDPGYVVRFDPRVFMNKAETDSVVNVGPCLFVLVVDHEAFGVSSFTFNSSVHLEGLSREGELKFIAKVVAHFGIDQNDTGIKGLSIVRALESLVTIDP